MPRTPEGSRYWDGYVRLWFPDSSVIDLPLGCAEAVWDAMQVPRASRGTLELVNLFGAETIVDFGFITAVVKFTPDVIKLVEDNNELHENAEKLT